MERRNSCRDYSTPFSHFFDTLGYDRRKGDLSAIEQASQEKNLSPSVKDWLLEIFSVYFEKHVHFEELQQRERGACSSATKCLKKINGTMPESQDYILNHLPLPQFVLFIELCMRGIGQGKPHYFFGKSLNHLYSSLTQFCSFSLLNSQWYSRITHSLVCSFSSVYSSSLQESQSMALLDSFAALSSHTLLALIRGLNDPAYLDIIPSSVA